MMTDNSNDKNEVSTAANNNNNEANSQLPEKCLLLKDKGNKALMEGSILDAITHYTEALSFLDTPNAIILANRAQAYIKVENYGLAIMDATAAIEMDPSYPKGWYRRGTANFALNKNKAARKDFKMVCKLKPRDKDARAKYAECDRLVKEAAFAAAIESEETIPLSQSYDPSDVVITSAYTGPHPSNACLAASDMDKEDALFQPGNLPMDFVKVSST